MNDRLSTNTEYLPADVTEPGPLQRKTAWQLAAMVASLALLSMLPLVLTHHLNLRSAPSWAVCVTLVAAVQLVYAAWLANAPDWASARVQMIVCAAVTTIYAMVMTLALIMPAAKPLILGLDEVRRMAPAWCGLMFLFMGAATWYCGRATRGGGGKTYRSIVSRGTLECGHSLPLSAALRLFRKRPKAVKRR